MNKEMQTMIIKKTKSALFAFAAACALCFGLAGAAHAALTDSEVHFSTGDDGNINVSLDGTGADVSAFSLVLDVTSDVADAVDVGFQFSSVVEEATTIHESTFATVGDKTRITLYVAGGHDLFAGSLDVGTITLVLDEAISSGAQVTVDVPEVDDVDDPQRESAYALRTVSGSYGEDDAGVFTAAEGTSLLGDRKATEEEPPAGGDDGDDGNDGNGGNVNGSGNDGNGGNGTGSNGNGGGVDGDGNGPNVNGGGGYTGMAPDDGLGPAGDDPARNYTNIRGDALSQTGDTLLPLVVGLLCVIAAASCALGFAVIARRKKKEQE